MQLYFEAIKDVNEKEAIGALKAFDNQGNIALSLLAISGKWGKGYLPAGKYTAKYWRNETREPFSLYGYGFFVYIEPDFKTNRSELGIHFDGNVTGSLGCIAIKAFNKEEAAYIYNKIKRMFSSHSEIPLEVKYVV